MDSLPSSEVGISCACKMITGTISHPFEYVKVLIQIGHEPFSPIPGKTLLGRSVLKYPNAFQYAKHIKTVEGTSGCFNGLAAKLIGSVINFAFSQNLRERLIENEEIRESEEESKLTKEDREELIEYRRFVRKTVRDLGCNFLGVVVSHPFRVVSIRIMAQFVGGENKYSGIFSSFGEIYRNDGIIGFFSGLVPRLLGETIAILITSVLTYSLNKYLLKDKEFQSYTQLSCSYFATMITYPFQVVSTCMIVSGSGLAAGAPPQMPVYCNWLECWTDLSQKNELKRGSNMFFRYYNEPSRKLTIN